jgi:cellulose biosynthesis protein BcsQ
MASIVDTVLGEMVTQFMVVWGKWIVGTAAVAIFCWIATKVWKMSRRRLVRVYRSSRDLRRAEDAVCENSRGLWLTSSIPINPPADYAACMRRSKPIIVVGNLKGGVGKTTLVANLMAHYAIKKNAKVLALDLDFQGSLSSMILTQADYTRLLEEQAEGNPSKAAQLIDNKSALWLKNVTEPVDRVAKARVLPSYYSLSAMENRVMVEWLIGKRRTDVRYHLARLLHDEQIQRTFDWIIIDAPPRLTTGTIQALCAATHVLVPTILDELSGESAGSFVDQLRINQELWPHLRLLGVVGTMTELNTAPHGTLRDNAFRDFEVDAYVAAKDAVRAALEGANRPLRDSINSAMLPFECFVPQKSELGRAAGNRIAYTGGNTTASREIRAVFDRLGDEIDRRLLIAEPVAKAA